MTGPAPGTDEQPTRWRVRVTGTVQGVGFRPFVYALAHELALTGFVGNDAGGVFAEVQGPAPALAEFVRRLHDDAPPLATVDAVRPDPVPAVAEDVGFVIAASATGSGTTSIPPDTSVCDACLAEMRNPADRRFGYPFIACTHCGPRYTMTTGLPYDRANTTMSDFPLCPACRAEYVDPASRRFHAQPTACADCGPSLSLPVGEVAAQLSAGLIVAIKGVGGYHLACDAGNPTSVSALRERKQRGAKPFAVMVRDLTIAHRIVAVDPAAEELLTAPERPIVVLAAGHDDHARQVARSVAPGSGTIGVMLPYAPLHHLLFDAGAPDVLVMTSGNLADEPISIDPDEAHTRLGGLADAFCDHNRRIHVACDDSVTRSAAGVMVPMRRSRGYAPAPIELPLRSDPVLAVGGELKTTVCAATGERAWLSQHIGDTGNLETLAMLDRTAATLCTLQSVAPAAIVSDLHPAYLSRRWAVQRAVELGIPHLQVQHHHAHLASLLAEYGHPPGEPAIGVVFDGTGYGHDGTIWGGELLVGDYAAVRRVGHLRSIGLPGGDAAIKHPPRTALAHLHATGLPTGALRQAAWDETASGRALTDQERTLLTGMLTSGSHCTPTTSVGRLFDAIASLLDVSQRCDYEGQAAIELEARAAAAEALDPTTSTFGWDGGAAVSELDGSLIIDPTAWLHRAVADQRAGVPTAASALAFHHALAEAVTEAVRLLADREGVRTVGLTGGVFSNAVLLSACQRSLSRAGLTVLTHRIVPANDGGLALGQVAVAAADGAL